MLGFPAVGEAAGGDACLGQALGVHDGVETGLDGGLVGAAHLVEDIADRLRPAVLDGTWTMPADRRRVGDAHKTSFTYWGS